MTNVEVQCCHCKGRGFLEHYRVIDGVVIDYYHPTNPYHMVLCPTCNGFGVVIATELKAVTAWESVRPKKPIG